MISERPLPAPDDATEPYWEGCRAHELRMQRCKPCGHLRFPPRPMCPRCQSFDATWVPVSGRGTVYSWVVCHPPLLPAFQDRAPLVVLLIELAESPELRIVGNLLDDGGPDLEIGMPVEVVFEELSPDVTLPQWKRSSADLDAQKGIDDGADRAVATYRRGPPGDKLVDNAVAFSQVGSEITFGLARTAGCVQLRVGNEGPLVPGELRERLFESMFSTREASADGPPHMGLGLTIVRLIAERLGGKVEVGNRADRRGPVFTLELPIA